MRRIRKVFNNMTLKVEIDILRRIVSALDHFELSRKHVALDLMILKEMDVLIR